MPNINLHDLKILLEEKVDEFNSSSFIEADPISIPHQLSKKEDIEIIGFIMATIAWGNRKSILKSGETLLKIVGHEPYHFVLQASAHDLKDLSFVHRTFNTTDLKGFIQTLNRIYKKHGGLELAFGGSGFDGGVMNRIEYFRSVFINGSLEKRTHKHISSPLSNSACKRINMFLRWMVRKDNRKVDFGIWDSISMQDLYIPLDIHTARISRELGLLNRLKDDWKALEELMIPLKKMDPKDPAKYDFALFGMGVNNS